MQAQADVGQGRDRAEALTQMLRLEDDRSSSIDHQRFLRTRTASTCTLRIMAARIAAPRKKLDCVAWAPRSTSPLLRQAITKAPIKAPITVPDPPVSAVPPITAAAMAYSVSTAPPLKGSAEPEIVEVIKPANAANPLKIMKVVIFMRSVRTPISLAASRLLPVEIT